MLKRLLRTRHFSYLDSAALPCRPAPDVGEHVAVGPWRVRIFEKGHETTTVELETARDLRTGELRERREEVDDA